MLSGVPSSADSIRRQAHLSAFDAHVRPEVDRDAEDKVTKTWLFSLRITLSIFPNKLDLTYTKKITTF